MKIDFGNRRHPVGTWNREEFDRLRPEWKQIRTANCAEVFESAQNCGLVDALFTRKPGIPLAVTTADCIPILLHRKDHAAVAAVHAGWQGTLLRIVDRFFENLPADLGPGHEWIAVIGPSMRACCYEFGEDLLEKFYSEFQELPRSEVTPKFRHLDLLAINIYLLKKWGVEIRGIIPDCTFCTREANGERRYMSYRSGDRDSRQYSIIMK